MGVLQLVSPCLLAVSKNRISNPDNSPLAEVFSNQFSTSGAMVVFRDTLCKYCVPIFDIPVRLND